MYMLRAAEDTATAVSISFQIQSYDGRSLARWPVRDALTGDPRSRFARLAKHWHWSSSTGSFAAVRAPGACQLPRSSPPLDSGYKTGGQTRNDHGRKEGRDAKRRWR